MNFIFKILKPLVNLFLFVLSLHLVVPTLAQVSIPYFFHRPGKSEGLNLFSCRTLDQDKQGNLWIGTHNGIIRFDGFHSQMFEGFTRPDSVHCLFVVNQSQTDVNGNIWFAHYSGLTQVNPENLQMRHWGSEAFGVAVNHRGEAVFNNQHGLWMIDKTGVLQRIDQLAGLPFSISELQIEKLFFIPAFPNHFWIQTQSGLFAILISSPGHLKVSNPSWLGSFTKGRQLNWHRNGENSFWVIDVDKGEVLDVDARTGTIKKALSLPPRINGNDLNPLAEDAFGNLWMEQRGGNGLLYLSEKKAFVRINHGFRLGEFQSSTLRSVLSANDKTIWLGTDNGLMAVEPDKNWLRMHHIFNPEDSSLKKDKMLDFTELDGDLWLTCAFGKLVHYNPRTGEREVFQAPGLIPGQSKNALPQTFYTLLPFGDDLMIGTRSGIVFFDPKTKQFYTKAQFQKPHWQHLISLLLPEKNKYIWAWVHDKRWIRIQKTDLKEDSITQFQTIKGRKYWISKPLVGPGKELAFELPLGYAVGIPSEKNGQLDSLIWLKNPSWADSIFSFHSCWNGRNLVCRNIFPYNIYLLDLEKKKYNRAYAEIINENQLFGASQFDDLGNIWLADHNAIGWLNPKTNRYHLYQMKFGSTEFMYDVRFIKSDDGKLFLKSLYEIAEIEPKLFGKHHPDIKPWFSGLKINGENQRMQAGLHLDLAPDQNNVSLEVGFLIPNPDQYKIEYKLNGEKWNPVGKGYRLDLISLKSGDYRISIRAISKDGFFQSKESQIAFRILPPFYRTYWFWILLFLMLAGMVYYYFRHRWEERQLVFDLETKALNLEKEKTIVQYESLKQQLNPHFLFNSLTSLGSLIRIDPKMAGVFLEAMSKSYRYILKSQEQELVPLRDELQFIQTFIQLQKVRFEESLQFEIDVSEENQHLKIVPVTLQNLIENAIKHNVMDEESPLRIHMYVSGGFLVVENNLQKKAFVESSNQKGLKDLRSLYGYLDNRPVKVEEEDGMFRIWIPLV